MPRKYEALWSGILRASPGFFVLTRYGFSREALVFNEWKMPLPVLAARLVFVPLSPMFLYLESVIRWTRIDRDRCEKAAARLPLPREREWINS
jgi:hypothetical protein